MNIWLHGVSVGETKAISTLVPFIRREYPDATLIVTSVTKTGHAEAKRSIDADAYHFLPLDLPWLVAPFVRRIKPDLFLLSETDYWPFLLRSLKKAGCTTAVVSGKLSDRSYKRLKRFPIARWLYKNIDHFFLQTETDKDRFATLGIAKEKLDVTGNLKFSLQPPPLEDSRAFRHSLGLSPHDKVVTIGSTHEREEELILDYLDLPDVKILVVPRHPQRFKKVRETLKKYPHAILVDTMGVLSHCYRISEIAIVGGSFVPVGGHDILEPIKCGIPTLFGPHMGSQHSLVSAALQSGYARQTSAEGLSRDVGHLLALSREKPPTFPQIAENTWLQIKGLKTIL